MSKPHRGSRYLLNKIIRSHKHLNIQWIRDNDKGFHSLKSEGEHEQVEKSSD